MAAANKVILIGNISREIEVKYLKSGMAVTNIGLAVNEKVKDGDSWVDKCQFFDVTVWGKQAESLGQYMTKGSSLYVEGKLTVEQWEKDEVKHSRVKITAQNIQFLGSRGGGTAKADSSPKTEQDELPSLDGEDLPF